MNLQRLLDRLPWSRSRTPPRGHPPATSSPPAPGPQIPARPRLDRLELQTAIIHHLEWCVLFNEHLSTDGAAAEHLEPLPDSRSSALGHWLATTGRRTAGQHPDFLDLQQEHLRFHDLAQQALAHARNRRMDLASTLLNTEFERSRARVLELLRRMQKS
ncbi:CZB domain-containing protein [Hydrogenophaga pseudoflava]|uniref:CZB domain-containing protein n=1 Tax=Hydrogenophaga pseudoflava TaxID=47421 RepID=UPI0027E54830|nr:CZB domain-containing protein [Hydrogenophaga pseudoflava]MDQ7747236.1 CZB domain-containing protein [Hydrogenophaga pseudoflava]